MEFFFSHFEPPLQLELIRLNYLGNYLVSCNLSRKRCSGVFMQLLFSNLLQKRLPREAGIDIICVHPGQVTSELVWILTMFPNIPSPEKIAIHVKRGLEFP